MATAKKTTAKPPVPASSPAAPPAAAAQTAATTADVESAITDLGTAQNLPECSGWAHHYADPAYADRTIQNFRDKGEGFRVMRIVVCDGVLAKAPVKPADYPEEP